MKKRLLALVCSIMLVAGMPMTAFAVSPSAEELVAPRVDLAIASDDINIYPAPVSQPIVATGNVVNEFKIGVLEALQEYLGTSIRVLNVLDSKNLVAQEGTPVAFVAKGVTAADNVKILAYNDLLGVWEYLPVATLDGEIYTIFGNYSKLAFIVDGILPENMRFAGENTEEAVVEYLTAGGAEQTALNGGKDYNTAMELTSNSLVAPWTGDMNTTYIIVAAAACAIIFMTSKKRLLALN